MGKPLNENEKDVLSLDDDDEDKTLYHRSIALIGSYHDPYANEMKRAAAVFTDHDIRVVHPTGLIFRNPEADFVTTHNDNPEVSNAQLQRKADIRMLLSTVVLAICPAGRLGDNTKEEVERLAEASNPQEGGKPLYFTALPRPTRQQINDEKFDAEDWKYIQEIAKDRIVDPLSLAYRMLGGAVTKLVVYDTTVDPGDVPQQIHIPDDFWR